MRLNLLITGLSLVFQLVQKVKHYGSLESVSAKSRCAQGLRHAAVCVLAAAAVLTAGCGDQYRPVVSAISPVGPASQSQRYAVAISAASPTTNGLVTIVDESGDSILITATLGAGPYYLGFNGNNTEGYTLNSDGTISSFAISPSLLSNQILASTLLQCTNSIICNTSAALPTSIVTEGNFQYVTQPGRATSNGLAVMTGAPTAIQEELTTGTDPVYSIVGSGAQRLYTLSAGSNTATAIEAKTNTISNVIPVGSNPIYGLMSADDNRTYVLNKGSGTVTVINSQQNLLDSNTALGAGSTIPVGSTPVWADYYSTGNELFVINQGTNTTTDPASLTIINTTLCSTNATSTVTCDPSALTDSAQFGQIIAKIPLTYTVSNVTYNHVPSQVCVMQDGSKVYVAEQDPSQANGYVTSIDLTTYAVLKTIAVQGHPTTIGCSSGTPTGKVYVTAPDSLNLDIIYSETDTLTAIVPLQGYGAWVRVTGP